MTDDWREKVGEGNEVEWKKRKEKHALLSRSVCFLFSFCSFHSFLLSFFAQSFVPLHYTSFILFISFSFLFCFNSMKWNVSEIKAKEKKEKRTNGTKELNLSEKNKARFTKLPLSCVLFHFKFSSLFLSLHLITSQLTTTDWPQPFSSLVRFVLPFHYITNESNKENDSGLAPTASQGYFLGNCLVKGYYSLYSRRVIYNQS